jgi:hypothetical protein
MLNISLTILYTARDLQKGYLLHLRKIRPFRSRLILILGIVLVVIGLLLFLLNWYKPDTDFLSLFLRWFFVTYGIVVVGFYFWSMHTIGKRMFKKMPDFQHPYTYTITEQGIVTKGKEILSVVEWGHFKKYVADDEMILLYPNELRFHLFPKKYFSGDDYALFKDWVEKRVTRKI